MHQKIIAKDLCQNFLMFFSINYMDSGLILKSLVHFEIILWAVREGSNLILFTCEYPIFPAPFIEKTVFSIEYSWLPCQIFFDHICTDLFLVSQFCSSVQCVIFMPVSYYFTYFSFITQLETRKWYLHFIILSQNNFCCLIHTIRTMKRQAIHWEKMLLNFICIYIYGYYCAYNYTHIIYIFVL